MLFDHVEHSEFYEFHDKAVEKFDTKIKEMKTKLENSMLSMANKKGSMQENNDKIALLRAMLGQELEYHRTKCNEIDTVTKK